MVRSILRSIQNSLVLMSVALCILAFQRLESLDVVHKASSPPSSLWPYPPPMDTHFFEDGSADSEETNAILKIGSHHELVIGREFHIGLFRFVLPVFKRQSKRVSYKQEEFFHSNLRMPTKKSPYNSFTLPSRVAFVVPITDCSEDTIDAAAVLEQSLPRDSGVKLYATLFSDTSVQCIDKLRGYEIMFPNVPSFCLAKHTLSLLIAHTIEADVAVYIPLPAIILTSGAMGVVPLLNDESMFGSENNLGDTTNDTAVLVVRPQEKKSIANTIELIKKQCNGGDFVNALKSFAINGIAPWKPCTRNGKQTCHVSNSVSVASFSNCPVPKKGESERNDTEFYKECQDLRREWLQRRVSARETQEIDTLLD